MNADPEASGANALSPSAEIEKSGSHSNNVENVGDEVSNPEVYFVDEAPKTENIPSTLVKLQGRHNFAIFNNEFIRTMTNWDQSLVQLLIHGPKVFNYLPNNERNRQILNGKRYFRALFDKNKDTNLCISGAGNHATIVTPVGVLTMDDWIQNSSKYLTHDVSERVLFYEHILQLKKLGDFERYPIDLALCNLTHTESVFLELALLNKLNTIQIKEILTYWVKVYNFLHSTWPPETFKDLYGFKSVITEVQAVVSPLNARLPHATNITAEWYAVLDFMALKGYTVSRTSLKRLNKDKKPFNLVNKWKFKDRHMARKKPCLPSKRYKCFNCKGNHFLDDCTRILISSHTSCTAQPLTSGLQLSTPMRTHENEAEKEN